MSGYTINVATVQQLQPAASVRYIQPAANITRFQRTVPPTTYGRVNLAPGRAAPKPAAPAKKARDNSTAMGVGKVDAAWFARQKIEDEKRREAIPTGNWTFNFGGSVGAGISIGGGVASGSGGHYWYNSVGIVASPGAGASATFSLSATRPGCQYTVSAFGFMGVFGGSISLTDGSVSIGVGIPGISIEKSCI